MRITRGRSPWERRGAGARWSRAVAVVVALLVAGVSLWLRAGVPVVAFDLRDDRRRPGLLMSERQLADVMWRTGDIGDPDAVQAVVREHGIGAQ